MHYILNLHYYSTCSYFVMCKMVHWVVTFPYISFILGEVLLKVIEELYFCQSIIIDGAA